MEYSSNERFIVREIGEEEFVPPLIGYVEVTSTSDGMVRAILTQEDFDNQYTEIA